MHPALPYHFFETLHLAQGLGLTSDAARPPARPPGRRCCRRRGSGIGGGFGALRARARVAATPRHARRRAHPGERWPRAPSGAGATSSSGAGATSSACRDRWPRRTMRHPASAGVCCPNRARARPGAQPCPPARQPPAPHLPTAPTARIISTPVYLLARAGGLARAGALPSLSLSLSLRSFVSHAVASAPSAPARAPSRPRRRAPRPRI